MSSASCRSQPGPAGVSGGVGEEDAGPAEGVRTQRAGVSGRGRGTVPASMKRLAADFRQRRKLRAVPGLQQTRLPGESGLRALGESLGSAKHGGPERQLPVAAVAHEHRDGLTRTQTHYAPVLRVGSPHSVAQASRGDSPPVVFGGGDRDGHCSHVLSRGSARPFLSLLPWSPQPLQVLGAPAPLV